ncbi:MAG: amidohydrolase family protein [Deltaproteobacteria bacterium]|nr:amidohydrolase family protein [Deltaproteobacteria bacterium]
MWFESPHHPGFIEGKILWRVVLALTIGGLALSGLTSVAGESSTPPTDKTSGIKWIDVHAHLVGGRGGAQDYGGAVEAALQVMDQAGIDKMVLMPPPQVHDIPAVHDYDSFLSDVKRHPTRFTFLGGGGSLNVMLQGAGKDTSPSERLKVRFEENAVEILGQGAAGFGEITAHHLSHLPGHPYESVAADHPLLTLLADIAARSNVVIDFHFDIVASDMNTPGWLASPPNPSLLRANLAAFERLLQHNRNAKIVWAHAGSDMLGHWTTDLSRRLLERHPNLYMSMRMAPGRAPQNHPLTRGGEIRPDWLRLLRDFPDRFVIGGDQFFVSPSVRGGGPAVAFSQRAPMIRERTRAFLEALSPDLARKIAYENAVRLYKLRD